MEPPGGDVREKEKGITERGDNMKERKSAPYDLLPGSEVIYTCRAGYEGQKKAADKELKRGQKYILRDSDIGSSMTYFHLEGIAGSFNSALFDIEDTTPEAGAPIEQTYSLECEQCGDVYQSADDFPDPQVCPKCVLKPCPFCNAKAEDKSCISKMDGNIFWVECSICGASIKTYTTKWLAFETWNERKGA